MSRIADVLQKARQENPTRDQVPHDPGEHTARPLAEVRIPWVLEHTASAVAAPPVAELTEAAPAAEKPRKVLTPRRVDVAAPRVDEAIASLVHNLFELRAAGDTNVRRVLFTSVDDSRGSAEIAPRIGEALAARANGSVCLADLDLHRPTLHHRFQLEGHTGFSDAVLEPGPLRACAHRAPSIANLWLMPAGLPTLDARPVLGDPDTHPRLRELLDTFDYVIAYTAPIGLHPDATLLGPIFDGVVLVVDANTTKPEVVRAAAETLERAKARLLGTVLNNPAD
jgi:protein-tyrosine kinase